MNITVSIRLIEYRDGGFIQGSRKAYDHGTLLTVFPAPGPLVGDRIKAGSEAQVWVVSKRTWEGIGCEPATLEVVAELSMLESGTG